MIWLSNVFSPHFDSVLESVGLNIKVRARSNRNNSSLGSNDEIIFCSRMYAINNFIVGTIWVNRLNLKNRCSNFCIFINKCLVDVLCELWLNVACRTNVNFYL